MSITVNDFHYKPGENDTEYINLLENALERQKHITNKAISKIKELDRCQRWIPCSEKLPGKYGCYRVTIEDVDGRYSDFRWFATEFGFEVHGDKVVAWEPAPEPYMGE